MKIAVCLSGHLRKFEQTFPTFKKHILNNNDCDVFIHTWDALGYACQYKTDNVIGSSENYLNRINRLYNPKKIIIEQSFFIEELKKQGDEYAPHLKGCPKHVGHMASMFYKIYAANALRNQYEMETGTKYDLIIRCRPDLIFHKINLPEVKETGRIYLPRFQCGLGWYSDQFAVGLPDDMDLYSSFFFNMQEYFGAKNEYYPEKFMDWSLKKANLIPVMSDFEFQILR